jgi:hypothetical protein
MSLEACGCSAALDLVCPVLAEGLFIAPVNKMTYSRRIQYHFWPSLFFHALSKGEICGPGQTF